MEVQRQIADLEAELNHRIYRLFHLSREQVRILQAEVAS